MTETKGSLVGDVHFWCTVLSMLLRCLLNTV
jgi:hypothetical protein